MPDVQVELHLEKRSRGGRIETTRWQTTIPKPEGWTRADFEPFILEERVEDPRFGVVRCNRYALEIVSADPPHGKVIVTYSVAASKSGAVTRCLHGTGWRQFGRSVYCMGGGKA